MSNKSNRNITSAFPKNKTGNNFNESLNKKY